MSVNLISPEGKTVSVPDDQVAGALAQGFKPEGIDQAVSRATSEQREAQFSGIDDKIATVGTRALGSATVGLSDAVLSELGYGEELKALAEANPISAGVGTVVGAVAPSIIPGLGFLPAGQAAKLGGAVTKLGASSGKIAKAAYATAGAATEGAIQNAGSYITDVALGDRELSADGFMGAMGKGALFGGVAGAALSTASGAMTAARRLFPKAEMTAATVQRAEREAIDEVAASLDDTAALKATAREKLGELRRAKAAEDPAIAAKMEEIRAARQREMFAKAETATAKAERAEIQAGKAKASVDKARGKVAKETAGEVAEEVMTPAGPSTPPVSVADDLMAQLQGTKAALDDGATIGQLGAPRLPAKPKAPRSPFEIEDAQNRILAEVDPNAAKLVAALDEAEAASSVMDDWLAKYGGKRSNVAKAESKMATEDWIAGRRNQGEGWQTVVPEGEGNIGLARGRTTEWRGSEEGRLAAEARINAKVTPADRESADAAVERMWGRRPEQVAAEAVDSAPRPDVDSALETALKRHTDDIDDDIAQSVDSISRHENAQANLADELGPYAGPRATERAAKLREAQRASEQKAAQAAADTAVDVDRALSNVSLPGTKGAGRGVLGGAADLGTAWEALHMMGVPLPDPSKIPVIGPVVSMFLKARVLGKAFGRFGGKVAETAETTIASKAAATKQRMFDAVDKIVDSTAKGIAKAAPKSGGAAAVLGHVLFDDRPAGEKRKPYTSEAKGGDLVANFQARADELARAAVPGAIRAAVRDRVRAGDPAIVDAIVAGQERKLGFLFEKLPKQDAPDLFMRTPLIAKTRMQQFARYVEAAEEPAGVLEAAARGESVSIEAAETLRKVYPRLYQEAQRRLIEKITDGDSKMTHARKVQAALLFDLPIAGSPDYAAFLQEPYQAQAISQQPAAPPLGQPTIAAPVNLGAQSDPYTR